MKNRVTILGGGLTGLSAAFHLSRRFPATKITLVERSKQLGGWVRSTRVYSPEKDASVLLEAGPRTLRPNARSVLELINIFGIQNKVVAIPKDSPAAQSRFLYIPPSYGTSYSGLQCIPSSIASLFQSPLLPILLPAVLQETLKFSNRPPGTQDESVDSFLRRRFGPAFAEMFGSAFIHGIYASDSRQISIRAAFPGMWDAEERGFGSILRGSLFYKEKPSSPSHEVGNLPDVMRDVSVYSFKDGMQTLTDALEGYIEARPNVEILRGVQVSSLDMDQDGIHIHCRGNPTMHPTHIISALPTPILHDLLPPSFTEPELIANLKANPASSVHVVNIVFPGPPSNIHPAGFGYLIPRPPQGYPSPSSTTAQEEFGILGTVFDSCSLSAQDTSNARGNAYENAQFTKLTVMIGGPFPLPPLPSQLSAGETLLSSKNSPPSGDDLPQYMKSLLKQLSTHLSRPLPTPVYWRILPNEKCIPTLLPGHPQRMQELQTVLSSSFEGKFDIVGAGVNGVSVGDCVEAGRNAAHNLSLITN